MVHPFNPHIHFMKNGSRYSRKNFQNLHLMRMGRLCRAARIAGIHRDAITGQSLQTIRELIIAWLPPAMAPNPNLTIVGRNTIVPGRTMGTRANPPDPPPQPQQQVAPQAALAVAPAAAQPAAPAAPGPAQPSVPSPSAAQSNPASRSHPASPPQASTSQHTTTLAQPPTHCIPSVPPSNQQEASGSTGNGGAQAGPSAIPTRKRSREREDDEESEEQSRRTRSKTSSRPTSPRGQTRRTTSRSLSREAGPSTAPARPNIPVDKDDFESEDGSSRPLSPSVVAQVQRERGINDSDDRQAERRRLAPLRTSSSPRQELSSQSHLSNRGSPAPPRTPSLGEPNSPTNSTTTSSRKHDRTDDDEEPEGQPDRQRSRRESRSPSRSSTRTLSTSQGLQQSGPPSIDDDQAARSPQPSLGAESMEESEEEYGQLAEDEQDREDEDGDRTEDEDEPRAESPRELQAPRSYASRIGSLIGAYRPHYHTARPWPETDGTISAIAQGPRLPVPGTQAPRVAWHPVTTFREVDPPSTSGLENHPLSGPIAGPSNTPASTSERSDQRAVSIAGPSSGRAAAREPSEEYAGPIAGPSGVLPSVTESFVVDTVPLASDALLPSTAAGNSRLHTGESDGNDDGSDREPESSRNQSHLPTQRRTRSPSPPSKRGKLRNPQRQYGSDDD